MKKHWKIFGEPLSALRMIKVDKHKAAIRLYDKRIINI